MNEFGKTKFVYLRKIDKIDIDGRVYDFSELTLLERLFFSVALTKKRNNDKRSYGEIIFNYDGFRTAKNFRDYDDIVTRTLNEKHEMLNWVLVNANEKKADGNWAVHAVTIDQKKIFATKNGKKGDSLLVIAWKAAALASTSSKQEYLEQRALNVYNWVAERASDRNTTSKSQIKTRIEEWCEKAEVTGEFKGDYFITDSKKYTNAVRGIRGTVKHRKTVEA